VLDFGSAEAFAPAEATISVGNLGSDKAFVTTFYVTKAAEGALFSTPERGAGPFRYYGVPAAKQIASDLHFAGALAEPGGGAAVDGFRFKGVYFKDATDRTLTMGGVLPAPAVGTAGTTPYVRLRTTGALPADYSRYVSTEFLQSQASAVRYVVVDASAAYLNNAATYDLAIPDFSGVAGWDNNWGLKVGWPTNWTMTGVGFTGSGVRSPNPVDGTTVQVAFRTGTLTP
jgi:hypothetical protein